MSEEVPAKGGISSFGWLLIGLFGFAAIVGIIGLLIPGKDDDSSPRSSLSGSAAPTKSSAKVVACPHDTDAELAAMANQAAKDIYARSGKVIDSNKIAKDVMATGPNHPRSCGELFALYVISETS